ncbi:transposase family protein [Enterococcus faecium]|nr:transposase family protein [Enterococcus faecium]
MNDSIKKMLRLIEKDLMITEVSYETFQKKKTLIVDAVFSPAPHTCRNCGSTVVDGNGKVIVVKNGKKETIVRFEQYNHMPLVMRLKKQRYTCKTVEPIGRLKVILFNPGIQSRIMSDIKLLLY